MVDSSTPVSSVFFISTACRVDCAASGVMLHFIHVNEPEAGVLMLTEYDIILLPIKFLLAKSKMQMKCVFAPTTVLGIQRSFKIEFQSLN